MKSKSNLVCAFISALPVIVLLFVYNTLPDMVYTKVAGGNGGALISKLNFAILTMLVGIAFYYAAYALSNRLNGVFPFISQTVLRVLFNVVFSGLSLLVILANMPN